MDPAQLSEFEALCIALYQGNDQMRRQAAQQQIFSLSSSVDFIPQCQYILDHSTQPYAQIVASSSLESLITQFWNNFTPEQKVDIKNYFLNYIATKANNIEDFVANQLAKVVARMTKLGWFESVDHRDIVTEASKFFKVGPKHYYLGLRILLALVDEMNSQTCGKTMTVHRKTAVSFRDQSLLPIFQISLSTLQSIFNQTLSVNEGDAQNIMFLALSLANKCLSFDFIGTNIDESAEDIGTVQIPSSWRAIIQDTSTLDLFFKIYYGTNCPNSNQSLECLIQLSSVRRSIFATDNDRNAFLNALMEGIFHIMRNNKGLDEDDNYHEFCRLLGRLKATYQLAELVRVPHFVEWLELSWQFTNNSFANLSANMNSINYLFALWGRLVAALPYLRSESNQRPTNVLKQCVGRVVQSYINAVMNCAETCDDDENPLDDDASLKEQLERFPLMAHLQYDEVSSYLLNLLETCIDYFESGQNRVLENKISWLTYLVASVIGPQSSGEPRKQSDTLDDAKLCKSVFRLIQLIMYKQMSSRGQYSSSPNIEKALLHFIRSFKKSFLSDGLNSVPITVPSSAGAHPLLAIALSSSSAPKETPSEPENIFTAMNIGEISVIMNLVVDKLCSNIQVRGRNDNVLSETLEVFIEMITSYSSSKTLLNLESVQFIIRNHTGSYFPFLGYDNDNKLRVKFYSALTRLVFTSSEDINNSFDMFFTPNIEVLDRLARAENLKQHSVRVALIGMFRDLRGIAQATYNKRTYMLLFELLHPTYFELFSRVADVYALDNDVAISLLKFLMEFVQNKTSRITFDQSSAGGILLFRDTSRILCTYGNKILQAPVVADVYAEKYKGIRLMLNVLVFALSGNYVNFGVFELYEDPALQNAMDIALQTCLSIPSTDIMAYVKLSKAYFGFLEVLFKNHLDLLVRLDSSIFSQLLMANLEGVQSSDTVVFGHCAATIDHLCTYIFLNRAREKPTMQRLAAHLSNDPDILNLCMSSLLNVLLFSTNTFNWVITRPILSLLLASEQSFALYRSQLIATQSVENQQKLAAEFDRLLNDVQQSLEISNRDKFTSKLTTFRTNVREFLTF